MSEKELCEKPYRYFDTPDGQDTFKKLWCVLKPTAAVAGGLGLFDVVAWSYPKGPAATAVRFASVGLPIIGIASTFVLATNSIASYRQKDDRLNWFMGGFIAGSCFGLWKRNIMWGFNMGMFCGIVGFLRKETALQGWEIIPQNTKVSRGSATTCLYDISWTAERPRGWTTGKE